MTTGRAADSSVEISVNHEPTQWLRDRFRGGPTSWCAHITVPLDPSRTTAVLALSDRHLCCVGCLPQRAWVTSACDRCSRVCPDLPDQRIRFGQLLVGLVVVVFGLCPTCADREFPLHDPASNQPTIRKAEPR